MKVFSDKELSRAIPDQQRLNKGGVAIVECFQSIPCNPCYTSCNRKAMKELVDINDLPEVDFDKCNGCGVCVSNCPGLAIFVVDQSYSPTHAIVKLPYEFTPLPQVNSIVKGADRQGNVVCQAKVLKVVNTSAQDRTPVIWLEVPKELSMTVRFFYIDQPQVENKLKATATDDNDTIICRCEGITLGEIRKYISEGYTTIDEIKRISRAGMGACQGRTCRQLILNEISKATNTPIGQLKVSTFRPPVKPIKLSTLSKDVDDDE